MEEQTLDFDRIKEKLENDLDEVIEKKKDVIDKLNKLESEENLLYLNLRYFQNYLNLLENNNKKDGGIYFKENTSLMPSKMNEIYEQNCSLNKEDNYSIQFIKNNFKKD